MLIIFWWILTNTKNFSFKFAVLAWWMCFKMCFKKALVNKKIIIKIYMYVENKDASQKLSKIFSTFRHHRGFCLDMKACWNNSHNYVLVGYHKKRCIWSKLVQTKVSLMNHIHLLIKGYFKKRRLRNANVSFRLIKYKF